MSETTPPALPDDVITDNILIRLPVKSVGRFRCVSKPWRSLLSGTKFARDHLNFRQDHEPEAAIASVSPERRDLTLSLLDFTTESSTKAATFPYWAELSGSCHGLVITYQHYNDLYLYNSITLEKAYVEPPEFGKHHIYSLGYDSSQGDYKIVSLSTKKFCRYGGVHVYSVRGKSWRRLGMCSYAQVYLPGGEFLNGFTHWLFPKNMKLFIVSFDYAREQLGTVPPPRDLDYRVVFRDSGCLDLGVVGGCLTVGHDITSEYRYGIRFWMMREYGVQDFWTEYTIWWPGDHDILEVEDTGPVFLLVFWERVSSFWSLDNHVFCL